MRVRTRLIIAFLVLSVLPLSAVTLYSYSSSVNAFRGAVATESERMAADLQDRLDTITADLGRQVELLWEPSVTTTGDPSAAPDQPMDVRVIERVAAVLGESAHLLERVEFTQVSPPSPPSAAAAPPTPPVPAAPTPPQPPPVVIDLRETMAAVEKELMAEGVPPEVAARLRSLGESFGPALQAGAKIAGSATRSAAAAVSAEGRQRAREYAERAREIAQSRRRAALEGDALAVPVLRDGELVGSINARLNLPRTLTTVLSSAQTAQGEIPFAIDAEGQLHTTTPEHQPTLASLNVGAIRQSGVSQRGDWVIVTREAPSNVTFGIARPIAQSLREIQNASMRSLLLGLSVIGLAVLGIVPLARHMTRDLKALTDGVDRIARGDFSAQVPVRSRDEFGALATAFNHMARDVAHHQQLVVEREGLQRELELCRRIQSEMLPHASLRLGLTEVRGISIPAREVGGDFFNYFELATGQIAVLVGDVSGKGISAALLMANIQATLRARLPLESDLAVLTSTIDREIDAATPPGVYATLFLGILDPTAMTLRYVNAGHHPQFLIRGDGIESLSAGGMPVGLYPGQGYSEKTVQLADNDLLFFYTDGMVEVENEQGEMLGAERLDTLLRTHWDQGVDTVLERVEDSVRRFRGRAEPFDDVTIMALRLGARPDVTALWQAGDTVG
jgi:serine phosphatase RsbU (regulator of sigma subunit)